jgi:hypothetical protein
MTMLRWASAFAIFTIVIAPKGGVSVAQTPSVFSPTPFVDRAAEKSRIKQEEDRKKWSACRKQARTQKVQLRHRNRFINDCMAK